MSVRLKRDIAIRAGPIPNAHPEYRSLSSPAASSTAGCTRPHPMISIQRAYAAVQKAVTTLDTVRAIATTELARPAN